MVAFTHDTVITEDCYEIAIGMSLYPRELEKIAAGLRRLQSLDTGLLDYDCNSLEDGGPTGLRMASSIRVYVASWATDSSLINDILQIMQDSLEDGPYTLTPQKVSPEGK